MESHPLATAGVVGFEIGPRRGLFAGSGNNFPGAGKMDYGNRPGHRVGCAPGRVGLACRRWGTSAVPHRLGPRHWPRVGLAKVFI